MHHTLKSNKPFPARHFGLSVRYAFSGLRYAFLSERNVRTHTWLTLLALGLGFYLRLAAWEWIAILLCIGLMLSVELLNTAIEWLVDSWMGDTIDERAKRIKDVSAAACLVSATITGSIGIVVFLPRFLEIYYK
jgi:undecaprenol kinase